jgi:hypothetical protein
MSNKVDSYRERVDSRLEELTILGASTKSIVSALKEDIVELKGLIKTQNGRIGENEKSIARMKGIGYTLTVVYGAIMAWLKLK